MRKNFTILMALVITFFTVPFGGITALADELDPVNLAEGDYTLDYTFLEKGTDEASTMDGFTDGPAYVKVDKNGKLFVEITFTGANMIKWFKVNGQEVKVLLENEDENTRNVEFTVDHLTKKQEGSVFVEVPGMYSTEHDVDLVFHTDSLEVVKDNEDSEEAGSESDGDKKDEEDIDNPEEGPGNGNESENEDGSESEGETEVEDDSNGSENGAGEKDEPLITNADRTYDIEYVSSLSIDRYFDNPVNLLYKDGKKYIQINGNSAQFITSLTINGEEVTWGEINDDNTYVIQFEIDSLADELDFGMKIDTGRPGMDLMEHNTILTFNSGDVDVHKLEVQNNKKSPVYSGDNLIIEGDKSTKLTMPEDLPEGVKVTVTSAEKEVENQGDLEIAGEVYNFNFEGIEDYKGIYELVMSYDADKYDADQVDIYYYHVEKGKWIAQKGIVQNGTITIHPTHFSTYGVFAFESEEDLEDDEKGTSEEYREVDYVVKHATEDKTSSANSFFTKPAHLIERDGETYIQLTIKSWGMINWLRTEHSDVTIIEENDDTAIVEFKVTGELSDAINLSMQVTVPGLYEMEHEARLFLDVNEDNNVDDEEKESDNEEQENGAEEKDNNGSTSGEKTEIVPEKAFEIDYVVKHATEDRTSAADSFFVKPAFLLYDENGEKYIQLIINDWDMIDWLRTEHGDVIVVQENNDGSALIQFKVAGDLTDEILLSMKVTVPGLYSMEHEARLIFDVDSQNEVEPSDYQIIVDPSSPQGPEKPDLGNGKGNEDNNDEDTVTPGNKNNPQTGDTTSIFLYTVLLIGSLIPLAVKLRRRFI